MAKANAENVARLERSQTGADTGPDGATAPLEPAAASAVSALAQPEDDPLLLALVTLTHLLERPASPRALCAGLPLAEGRLTLNLVPRAAGRAGLSARAVRRPLDAISNWTLPAILLLRDGQACVLVRADTGAGDLVILPETGRGTVTIPRAELEERYIGQAIFAKPELGHIQRERDLRSVRQRHWFWGVLAQNWPVYGEVLVASVMINLFALASPLFIMNVYDRVVPNEAIETLWVLAAGALIVFGFDFLLKVLRGYFVDAAGRRADLTLSARIFEQVMGMKMMARPASAGAFASNLREFESLRDFFTSATIVTLVDLPFVFFFIAIIWLIGGPVALVPALAVPLVLGIGLALQVPLNRVVRRTFKEGAQKHGILVEAIGGLETIKTLGAESRMQRSWERFVAATAHSGMQSRFLSAMTVNIAGFAANVVTIGVVVYGVYRIGEGLMTVGALVACTIIAGRAMAPLGQVAGVLSRVHQARAALNALNSVMRLPTERDGERQFVHRPTLAGGIEFKDVTFTYPEQKLPALRQVSLRLEPGEKVGLIGRIGSGKTTLEKMILGLYEPEQGAVLIDGTDARQLDPADLRRNIGCVPQDVFLFQGTLRENIALGAPQVDDERLLAAARTAGVHSFASRHPLGYDMHVGERGELLSGGQRQAVAIARALLHDPPILVLDEPTSAMDNGAENRFKAELEALLPDRTLLLITHRTSMLNLVDRLIVMDGGRVLADGPKEQILKALAAGQLRGEA